MVFTQYQFCSILCIARRNPQRSSPHRRTRCNTSPGRAGREEFLLSFVLCSLVYVSSLFSAISLIFGEMFGRAKRKFFQIVFFCLQSVGTHSPIESFFIFRQTRRKVYASSTNSASGFFKQTHGPRKSSRKGEPLDC